jgi:Tfp pilus assembly protein PilV
MSYSATTLRQTGFTLIEVLIILMVVGTGLFSVVALAAYGTRIAELAQGKAIAMSTAISIAFDPRPRLDPEVAGDWSYMPYSIDGSGILTSTAQGYVNGLFVERIETSRPEDVLARSTDGLVHARSAHVQVTVADANNGGELTSFATRIIRQRQSP